MVYNKSQTLALKTFIKLMRCSNSVSSEVHNFFSDRLTVSQFGILEALFHLGPMSQKELGKKILKSPGNLTTVINNLLKNNLIHRVTNENDKRFYTIDLSPSGKALIEDIFPDHAYNIEQRFSILSHDEQKTLGSLLRKLSLGIPDNQEDKGMLEQGNREDAQP